MFERRPVAPHSVSRALVLGLMATLLAGTVWAQEGKTIFGDTKIETLKAMRGIVKSLGVKKKGGCLYCHVKEKGKMDFTIDTPNKKIVRMMKRGFVDSLAAKGRIELSVAHEGKHPTQLVAEYLAGGDSPGIHLTAVVTSFSSDAEKKETSKTFSSDVSLPEKGADISCMTCHNGSVHFLTEAHEKK